MSEQERRDAFRLDMSIIPAADLLSAKAEGKWSISGTIDDLGADGAGLTLFSSDVRAGRPLHIRFALGGREYDIDGQVRWVRDDPRHFGQRVGVRFDKVAAAERRRLFTDLTQEQARRS